MTEVALAAMGVTYGYRSDVAVLRDVHREFIKGSVTALTGPSGTGKSTLLYLLAGLLTPWAGSVTVEGQDMVSMSDLARARLRARRFGFVFQDVVLDERRTVLDAILEPALYSGARRAALRERALTLVERLGVRIPVDALPGEISGGQAQRVGVCRALILEPTIIFADEPTGNLDNDSASAVLDALAQAAGAGSTVLIATHDDRVVERCTDRLVLR